MERRRAVVLGASGFIGSHLADALERAGSWAVERHSSKTCNLLDGPGVVRMLAGGPRDTTIVYATGINRASGDSFANMELNLRMVHNLATAVRTAGNVTNVIFLSTVDVYGFPANDRPIDEDTPQAPVTYYGLGKLAAERILQWELPAGVKVAILRLPGVFGRGDRGGSLLGRFATSLLANAPITLAGGGEVRRDLLPVRAVEEIVAQLGATAQNVIVNVVTGRSRSLHDWVQLAARVLARTPRIVLQPARGVRDHDLNFSAARVRECFPTLGTLDVEAECERYLRGRNELA